MYSLPFNYKEIFPEGNATIDIDEGFSNLTVIEREDMAISYTRRIATRYTLNKTFWLVKRIAYNASDEVIYIETLNVGTTTPEFIPEGIL